MSPKHVLSVIRPEDFLVLRFEFFNFNLKEVSPGIMKLSREGTPAYIAVHFPAQSIVEKALYETTPGWSSDETPSTFIQMPSRISGGSRLVFEVPDEITQIDYTLSALLQACKDFEQQVVSWAQPRPKPGLLIVTPNEPWMRVFTSNEVSLISNGEGLKIPLQRRRFLIQRLSNELTIKSGLVNNPLKLFNKANQIILLPFQLKEPEQTHTAIEAPWRLFLSPSILAAWAHSLHPVIHNGRTECWHTRLGVRVEYANGKVSVDEENDYYRTVRAIWSKDYKPSVPTLNPFKHMALTPEDREDIVALTSDRNIPTLNSPEWKNRVVQVERLMLTGLGAWINTRYASKATATISLEQWKHQSTMARDHYVRVVRKGYLFPFGQRASKIEIYERKFHPNIPGNPAYVRKREYIIVRKPEKDYTELDKVLGIEFKGRKMPFQRVRITTIVTPNLDPPNFIPTVPAGKAYWPKVNGKDFLFHIIGVDWDDQSVEFTAPLIFVDSEIAFLKPQMEEKIKKDYDETLRNRRAPLFNGQRVAFADCSSENPGDTSFETETIEFSVSIPPGTVTTGLKDGQLVELDQPRFYPIMNEAKVNIPAIKQLVDGAAKIKFDNTYLSKGFDPTGTTGNKGQVFVQVFKAGTEQKLPLNFGSSVKKNADKAGGIITPNIEISGISRLLGPIGGDVNIVANAKFDPADFFSGALEAKILGGIPLAGIIKGITDDDSDFRNNLEKVPKMISREIPTAIETSFKWQPEIKAYPSEDDPIFKPGNNGKLTIDGYTRTDLASGDSKFQIKGEMKNFEIRLFPPETVISLNFASLTFTAKNGQKPTIKVDLPQVKFLGMLSFLNKLQECIPDAVSGPNGIEVTPEGLTAGYSVNLPDIAFGVFSLKNLSLAGKLVLPFTGEPALFYFNFATRDDPFILTVSLFGGGGYFCIAVGLKGIHGLEASLDFGASISLNLAIATGGVEVIGGVVYEKIGDDVTFTAFLRMSGHLEVLGFFGVSVEFEITLNYQESPKLLYGTATLEVEVDFGLWSVGYDIEVERKLSASSPPPPTFANLIDQKDWENYCLAFAAD